eukprot:3170818-Karenia_brevis.AAC.1
MPIQIFRPFVLKLAFDAIHLVVSKTRTYIRDMPTFDPSIFVSALPTSDRHACNVLKSIASCSSVDQSLLHRFNAQNSKLCIFCGQCVSSVHHILWECTHEGLVHARNQHTHPSQQHVLDALPILPLHMLYGLTPPLALMPCNPYWANDDDNYDDATLTTSTWHFTGVDSSHPRDGHLCQWLQQYSQLNAREAFE